MIFRELLAFHRSNRTLSLSDVQIFYFPIAASNIYREFTGKMLIGYIGRKEKFVGGMFVCEETRDF